jgi:hypothetical protein
MADAKIFPFPAPGSMSRTEVVNEWVTRLTLSDEQVQRLEGVYRQQGMAEERHVGREVLNIADVELSFAQAVVRVADGVILMDEPDLEIVANTDHMNPLAIAFIGWRATTEEVTAGSRAVVAGTDRILEGLGLDFRLGEKAVPRWR